MDDDAVLATGAIFKCDSCSYTRDVPIANLGVKARCPKCRNVSSIAKKVVDTIKVEKVHLLIACSCGFEAVKEGPPGYIGRVAACPRCKSKANIARYIPQADVVVKPNSLFCKENFILLKEQLTIYNDKFERALRHNDYVNVGCVLLFLLSFKFVDVGGIGVVAYMCVISFLAWHQLNRFRLLFRRIWVDAILNEGFFLTKILRKGTLLKIISMVSAILISFVTLGFIYQASTVYVLILTGNVAFFVYVNKAFSVGFRGIFKSDISDVFAHFTSVAINVMCLGLCVFLTSYFSSHQELVGLEIVDIPFYIKEHIHHSCRVFQHYLRAVAYIDYNIIKLKDVPHIGDWIYSVFTLTHFSVVPFTCISFLYKCVCRSGANAPGIRGV